MRKKQTLIQNAVSFSKIYQGSTGALPPKTRVKTLGRIYQKRLNKAHQLLLGAEGMTKTVIGTTNFLTAEIVLIVQTPAKRVPISFPIFTGDNIYNYENLPNVASNRESAARAAVRKYKLFLEGAHDKTETILTKENLGLTIVTTYLENKMFPQIAYHSEKFFFYYLMTGGLEKVIDDLFPTKDLTPQTVISIDAIELRFHSTRDMCTTCEHLTLSEQDSLKKELNRLLISKRYPALPENFKSRVVMSFNKEKSTRTGKLKEELTRTELMRIRSALLPQPRLTTESYLNLHRYTYFTSGGSDQSKKGKRAIWIESARKVKQIAQEATLKIETKAVQTIEKKFKRYFIRKVMSLLSLIYKKSTSLMTETFRPYLVNKTLSITRNMSQKIKERAAQAPVPAVAPRSNTTVTTVPSRSVPTSQTREVPKTIVKSKKR